MVRKKRIVPKAFKKKKPKQTKYRFCPQNQTSRVPQIIKQANTNTTPECIGLSKTYAAFPSISMGKNSNCHGIKKIDSCKKPKPASTLYPFIL